MSKTARTMGMAVTAIMTATLVHAAPPLPGFSLKAQTPRFSFYARGDVKIDARKSEQFLTRVERLLGASVTGRAEYYRYSSAEELAAGTGTYASGVTFARAREIHSTEEFHAHEIVHLVAGQLGDPGNFFQEGLAVALGNDSRWNGKNVDALAKPVAKGTTVSALLAGFDSLDPQASYPVAGSFVTYLIRAHGVDKVAEFFRACGTGARGREVAFNQVFGRSLDEAGAAWAASL